MARSNLEIADRIDAAADLLEKQGAWTQGKLALDVFGKETYPAAGDAVCWCTMGVFEAISSGDVFSDEEDFFRKYLADTAGFDSIVAWNDAPERKQSDVVNMLRAAAVACAEGDA